MSQIKKFATVMNIHRIVGGEIVDKESYNVVPDGNISFSGNQEFNAMSIPLVFLVVGKI